VVHTNVKDRLFTGIPLLFKMWLIVPIIAVVAAAYLVYHTVLVWRQGRLAGTWARVRMTLVAALALFTAWFFYYWNILGFQYR
jgi:hypothetical protein